MGPRTPMTQSRAQGLRRGAQRFNQQGGSPGEIPQALPFRWLGIDADKGSEFLNWHVARWCVGRDIQFTLGRPYQKDDNAHIEQKNWTHVRKWMGYAPGKCRSHFRTAAS